MILIDNLDGLLRSIEQCTHYSEDQLPTVDSSLREEPCRYERRLDILELRAVCRATDMDFLKSIERLDEEPPTVLIRWREIAFNDPLPAVRRAFS